MLANILLGWKLALAHAAPRRSWVKVPMIWLPHSYGLKFTQVTLTFYVNLGDFSILCEETSLSVSVVLRSLW